MYFTNYGGFAIVPNSSPICLRGFDAHPTEGYAASFVVPIVAWVIETQHESRDRDGDRVDGAAPAYGVRVDLLASPIALDVGADFSDSGEGFPNRDTAYCYEVVIAGVTRWLFPDGREFAALDEAIAYGIAEQQRLDAARQRREAREAGASA